MGQSRVPAIQWPAAMVGDASSVPPRSVAVQPAEGFLPTRLELCGRRYMPPQEPVIELGENGTLTNDVGADIPRPDFKIIAPPECTDRAPDSIYTCQQQVCCNANCTEGLVSRSISALSHQEVCPTERVRQVHRGLHVDRQLLQGHLRQVYRERNHRHGVPPPRRSRPLGHVSTQSLPRGKFYSSALRKAALENPIRRLTQPESAQGSLAGRRRHPCYLKRALRQRTELRSGRHLPGGRLLVTAVTGSQALLQTSLRRPPWCHPGRRHSQQKRCEHSWKARRRHIVPHASP